MLIADRQTLAGLYPDMLWATPGNQEAKAMLIADTTLAATPTCSGPHQGIERPRSCSCRQTNIVYPDMLWTTPGNQEAKVMLMPTDKHCPPRHVVDHTRESRGQGHAHADRHTLSTPTCCGPQQGIERPRSCSCRQTHIVHPDMLWTTPSRGQGHADRQTLSTPTCCGPQQGIERPRSCSQTNIVHPDMLWTTAGNREAKAMLMPTDKHWLGSTPTCCGPQQGIRRPRPRS